MTATVKPIPITVFTGFLGAGKTSVILSLLPLLPKDYKVVLLKNEFGDIEVDSQLAKQSSLTAVTEILNGCMCCILVGQMETALLEIKDKFQPDRIIIECSGSAFPATLAFQIRHLEQETSGALKLDAIVTVIDAENFSGYEDTSPTAKMQASYSDVILINKWEHISERDLDFVIDHLNTLNDTTPKIRCTGGSRVDPDLIFGLESNLFMGPSQTVSTHHDEVETVTVYRGSLKGRPHSHSEGCNCDLETQSTSRRDRKVVPVELDALLSALDSLSKEVVWRVKGFIWVSENGVDSWQILNWAFGRFELSKANYADNEGRSILFTMMGEQGEVKRAGHKFAGLLGGEIL